MTSPAKADRPIQLCSHQPETAVALLRVLGIQHAPIEQQKPLLRTWLTANPPSTELRISLRRSGYGFVLDDIFGRPTACNCVVKLSGFNSASTCIIEEHRVRPRS